MTNAAAIYLRVSTEEQASNRNGLHAQEDAARAAAERAGFDVVGVFIDAGVSGAAPLAERPGLLAALAALPRGGVLLVAKLDRVSRDRGVSVDVDRCLAARRCRLVSASGEGTENDDPASILLRHILDATNAHERLVIAARTRAALQARKARGQKNGGGVPYGHTLADDGVTLLPHEGEQAVIREARTLRAAGLSLRAVAAELAARGFVARTSKVFDAQQVRRMVAA